MPSDNGDSESENGDFPGTSEPGPSEPDPNEPGPSERNEQRNSSEWWKPFCSDDELKNIGCSAKLMLLFSIIAECADRGQKLLVFSQSLFSLNVIEEFLCLITKNTQEPNPSAKLGNFTGIWEKNVDYFRLDGSTNILSRTEHCKAFNDEKNSRAKYVLFETLYKFDWI